MTTSGETNRLARWLLLLLITATQNGAVTESRFSAGPTSAPLLECGATAAIPANISQNGGTPLHNHGALYTTTSTSASSHKGRNSGLAEEKGRFVQPGRCRSRLHRRKQEKEQEATYVHVITDVFRPGCGAEISDSGRRYSITIHVRHAPNGRGLQRETVHTLSCYFDTPVNNIHRLYPENPSDTTQKNSAGSRKVSRNVENKETGYKSEVIPARYGGIPRNIHTKFGKKNTPFGFEKPNFATGFDDGNHPTRSKDKDINSEFIDKDISPEFLHKPSPKEVISEDIHTEFLSHHLSPNQFASRLVNEVDERMMIPVENDLIQPPPQALSQKQYGHGDVSSMTSSPKVLQLNVVDADGNLTTVVYPGKLVALELHGAHDNSLLGQPMVTSCQVSNPLEQPSSMDNMVHPDFSPTIIQHGCGDGTTIPRDDGFAKSIQGFSTPFFPIPSGWTRQAALIVFSCDVTICADAMRCQQKCPPQRRKPFTLGLHDFTLLLGSQMVTSCPSLDDVGSAGDVRWDSSLVPKCLPDGHSLPQPSPSPELIGHNVTAAGAAGSEVSEDASLPSSSWLAGNLHYVIIISVLVLLVLLFMATTFCQTSALQRHLRHARKETAREARERTDSEHQDQMTQTPRPLPRTPNARGQNPNRHSRQGGDGASFTVLQQDDEQVPASRPASGGGVPVFDSRRNSLPSPPPAPHQRNSLQPRPQPYDIPPSHEPQQEFRTSVSAECVPSPFLLETSQRSSKVKSFQTSTKVEEKNSERHTTIIEIKTPAQRDCLENGMAWNTGEHLATFTGGSPANSSNTLERGVVLGVNSLRRHLDRENQHVPSQPRDRRPITAHEPLSSAITPQMYYNTPSLCSEESSLKELMLNSSPDGGIAASTALGGIRTSPHKGSRKGPMPVVINTVEETTRL